MKNIKSNSKLAQKEPAFVDADLKSIVQQFIKRQDSFLSVASKFKTPCYVYDIELHQAAIDEFKKSFISRIPDLEIYYPMKLNHHPYLIQTAIKNNIGIEVASIRELKIAMKNGANKILYYAPGKTNDDISFLIRNSDRIVVNVDSIGELHKIGRFTNQMKKKLRLGVRVNLPLHGEWTKYGINLQDLYQFWTDSYSYPNLTLEGIHFHTSRNRDTTVYVESIKQIAFYLQSNFTDSMRAQIKYVDFGGGFDTSMKEGIYPWETIEGRLSMLIDKRSIHSFKEKYKILKSPTLAEYATDISNAINCYLRPLIKAKYFTEPGRIICNDAMHILVRVVDVKDKDHIIVDGGVNLVGWQRFEHEYFPVINLSNPSTNEQKCIIYGNLCTTWDLWGYYLYGKEVKEGDVLLIPYQGALTYTLAQSFINSIAKVHRLEYTQADNFDAK